MKLSLLYSKDNGIFRQSVWSMYTKKKVITVEINVICNLLHYEKEEDYCGKDDFMVQL